MAELPKEDEKLFLANEIDTHICQYLTLTDYPRYAAVSRSFRTLSLEILKGEAVYFGGNKNACLSYLKGLCSVIADPLFPPPLVICKDSTSLGNKRKKGKVDFRATLCSIRCLTLNECSVLFTSLDVKANALYPLILLSPLQEGETMSNERKTKLLYHAANSGFVYLSVRLFVVGADPNALSSTYTAFHRVILNKDKELVNLFLFQTADPNKVTSKSSTPLLLAALTNDVEIFRMLLERGARDDFHAASNFPSALYLCLIKDQFEMAKLMKAHGRILESRDRNGGNYLHMAMRFQQDWMLENFNPGPFLNSQDRMLDTPLHIAMHQRYAAGIRFLAQHRARYDLTNLDDMTALDKGAPEFRHLFNY